MSCLMLTLIGCLANKTEYVQTRLDKAPEDTTGVLRPAKRQKLLVSTYNPGKESPAGYVQGDIGPEYLLIFETDFVKMINSAKNYNCVMKNMNEMVKNGKLTPELVKEIQKP